MSAQSPWSLDGRTALVTGATGGMGRVIATELARRGAAVVVVARRLDAAQRLAQEVTADTGRADVTALAADLSSQASVRALAAAVGARHERLHLLVNNAGAHFRDHGLTADGVERRLAVDHLAGFLLTRLLTPTLLAGAAQDGGARVVNVVSDSFSDTRTVKLARRPRPARVDLAELAASAGQAAGARPDGFAPMPVYARAKLATLLAGYALARRMQGAGVTVNAVHPGLVATAIVGDVAPAPLRPLLPLVRRFLLTPEQGARGALHLATAPELGGTTGAYFRGVVPGRSPEESYDVGLQEQVWEVSSRLVGLDP